MTQYVPTKIAAQELGCSQQALWERMRRGVWSDLGDYIPKEKTGNKVDTFRIYRAKLDRHLGIEERRTSHESNM